MIFHVTAHWYLDKIHLSSFILHVEVDVQRSLHSTLPSATLPCRLALDTPRVSGSDAAADCGRSDDMVKVKIEDARDLCQKALKGAGYSDNKAAIITNHLVDAELRGHPFAGLARALSIIETLGSNGKSVNRSIKVTRSGPAFARVDGNGAVGYLVAHRATTR